MQAHNRDLSEVLSRAWSCQQAAHALLEAWLGTVQSQGQAAEPGRPAGELQSAACQSTARQQQEKAQHPCAIEASKHAASEMNQNPAPLQGLGSAAVLASTAVEAPSAAEEAHKKLQADYDALLDILDIFREFLVALGQPAAAESITAYLKEAKVCDAPQQQQQQQHAQREAA